MRPISCRSFPVFRTKRNENMVSIYAYVPFCQRNEKQKKSLFPPLTINPDIFFKRLDLFYKELEFISRIEPYVTSQKISPDFLTLAYNKKQSLIFNFLKGYFSSVLEKISILKTNKSKACSLQSFYYSLENYKSCMNEENINYYTNLYNTSIKNYLEIAVY